MSHFSQFSSIMHIKSAGVKFKPNINIYKLSQIIPSACLFLKYSSATLSTVIFKHS